MTSFPVYLSIVWVTSAVRKHAAQEGAGGEHRCGGLVGLIGLVGLVHFTA